MGFTDIRGGDGTAPPYLAQPKARLVPDTRSVGELAPRPPPSARPPGLLGAHAVLDDLAKTFGVDPSRKVE